MKKVILTFLLTVCTCAFACAQNNLNDAADNIVGTYSGLQDGEKFKAKIVKLDNGTYQCQIIWMENDKDKDGNKRLDTKNPDKKLRNTPCDRIVLFTGLEYNTKKKRWEGTKIYDPLRGIKANLIITFEKDGRLCVKGSILAFSESVYWTKIK